MLVRGIFLSVIDDRSHSITSYSTQKKRSIFWVCNYQDQIISSALVCYDPGCEYRYNWLERKEALNNQTRIEMEDQTDLHRAKPKEKKCRRETCDEEKIQEIWKVGDKEV